MLNDNQGQFVLHTEPLEAESRFLLHRVLLKDEEIHHIFSGYGCFGAFTNKRMIFINRPAEPANQTLTDECEFLPYNECIGKNTNSVFPYKAMLCREICVTNFPILH